MFDRFRELFSSENLLDAALADTVTMLKFDHQMFDASRKVLRESDTADLPFDIRQTDRKIHKFEREVRRNVLTHLTIAGNTNLVPGLALVSIVIDVERIGDYTKNIVDLANSHELRLLGGIHQETLESLEQDLNAQFPIVIDVLGSQDREQAEKVMLSEDSYEKKCESVVRDMIAEKDSSLATGDAVCIALYARYLKRINAHLANIASSIVHPFPRIGFKLKQKKIED
ncbi:hypothetical protein GF377_10185 [candidate division GN15 bacterium]|nr:hypothetical protein [candidate division GN15 bacterium]